MAKKLDFKETFECFIVPEDLLEITHYHDFGGPLLRTLMRSSKDNGSDTVVSAYLTREQVEDMVVVLQYWLDQTEEKE
jgi:hypothetical protein